MSTDARSDPRFNPNCRTCARLTAFLDCVRVARPSYHAAPVPPFGASRPKLLIVGLAPGMHGANRTGRPFTGDYAGVLLYQTLHRFGFASSAQSVSSTDGLRLRGCCITNAVKCLPPQNKPAPEEVAACNGYLASEVQAVRSGGAILALGGIAHRAAVMAFALKPSAYAFKHGASHVVPGGRMLFDSYHCSRYNTQTKRLTESMFVSVFEAIANHLDRAPELP